MTFASGTAPRRTQIGHFTGHQAVHPATLLREAALAERAGFPG